MTLDPARQVAFAGWESETSFGYAQGVRAGDMIYMSGQAGLAEDGTLISALGVDGSDGPAIEAVMADQMKSAYAWVSRTLAQFGADLSNVVEERLYVTDVRAAFSIGGAVRKAVFGVDRPPVASTLIGVAELALPCQLIEISVVAFKPMSKR